MKNQGLHIQPGAGGKTSTLRYHAGSSNFGPLVPSIRFMAVLEHQDTLEMTGIFGHDPGARGKLIIGGTELPIGSWEPGLIRAFIPNTGAGSVGPVTVEVDGRKSNTVNLTEWNGPITYHYYDAGSLKGTIAIAAHFRADVHTFRDAPHQTPHPHTLYISAAEDSYGSAKVEGTYTLTEPGNPPSITTWDWSGSGPLKGLWEQDPLGFMMVGPLDPAAKTYDLQIEATTGLNFVETATHNPGGSVETNPIGLQLYGGLFDNQLFRRFHLIFDDVWNINPGFRQQSEDCCSHDPDAPELWHDVVWPQIPASWAPDPEAGH
jgi:hypothetical protein